MRTLDLVKSKVGNQNSPDDDRTFRTGDKKLESGSPIVSSAAILALTTPTLLVRSSNGASF